MNLAIAGGALLAGAAVTVATLSLTGWRFVPEHEYRVEVRLGAATTVEQSSAVRTVLEDLSPETAVTVDTREMFFERVRARTENEGMTVPESVSAADMPETVTAVTVGRDFDCDEVVPLVDYPGVDNLTVFRTDGGDGRLFALGCR